MQDQMKVERGNEASPERKGEANMEGPPLSPTEVPSERAGNRVEAAEAESTPKRVSMSDSMTPGSTTYSDAHTSADFISDLSPESPTCDLPRNSADGHTLSRPQVPFKHVKRKRKEGRKQKKKK